MGLLSFRIDENGLAILSHYFSTFGRHFATFGTVESGKYVMAMIKAEGDTKYSRNLELITSYQDMTTWVSPSKEYFEDQDAASKEAYQKRFHRCTYARYLMNEGKLEASLKKIADSKAYEPKLNEIAQRSRTEIKKIMINNIKFW
jgi:hypothetical protein